MDDFVLAVDLDGVCADYTAALAAVVEDARDIEPGSLSDPEHWDFRDWDFQEGDFAAWHRVLVEYRGLRHLEPFPGVSESLWRLSDLGVHIRILTHRLVVSGLHSVIADDTVQWLEDNVVPYRDLCFMGSKADMAADLYVDDGPHNITALQEAGKEVAIFDHPYNRHLPGLRVWNWNDVEALVVRRVRTKGEGVYPR